MPTSLRPGPPRALVQGALEALRHDRRERNSCAVRVGFVLVDLLERPWTFRDGIRRLKEALGGEYYLDPPETPLTPEDLEDPQPAPPEDVLEIHRLLEEPGSLRWRLAPLLGNAFMTAFLLWKRKRRQAWTFLKPATRRAPLTSCPEPFVPLPVHPHPAPALAFAGPEWLRTLVGLPDARPEGGPLLIAVQGRAGREALRTYAGPRAVWLVDGHVEPSLELRPDDVLFVADPRLQRGLERPARWLPPAVNPHLQNPWGWWHEAEERPHWPGEERLPVAWRPVQDAARGAVPPGEAPGMPRWADEAWETEADRFLRMRETLRHDTLAHRLDEVQAALGLPPTDRELPLVSLLISTNRPDRAVSALESVRRQRYPRRELVMVLHGPGFDVPGLRRAAATLEIPFEVVQADARQTLGHCYGLGARRCRGRYVAIMDDDNWFGARYLEDAVLWMECSGAMVGGKYTMPVFLEEDASLHLILRDREFRRMQPSSAQAIFRREVLEVLPFRAAAAAADTWFFEDCLRLGIPLATFDRFNFAYCRGPRRHSYEIRSEDLLATYKALPLGRSAHPSDCDL